MVSLLPQFAVLTLIATATLVWISGLPFSADGDLYLHLKCGEWILAHGAFLTRDIFTYTTTGAFDETSQSWLSQVIFALVFKSAGPFGLKALHATLVLSLIALVFTYVWKSTRNFALSAVLSTLTLLLQTRMSGLRPLLFGELFVFYFLLYGFAPLTQRRTCFYLALALLWAQLHASQILFIPLSLAIALAHLKRGDRKMPGILFIGAGLVSLMTPMGADRFTYVFDLLRETQVQAQGEWAGARPIQWLERDWWRISLDIQDLTLIVANIVALGAFIRRPGWQRACLLGISALPYFSIRHLCFLVLPIAVAARHFPFSRRPLWGFMISLVLLFLFPFYESYYVNPPAEKASRTVKQMQLSGNIFNYHPWGSLLIYDQYPRAKVAVDNRSLLHRDFFHSLQRWQKNPDISLREQVLAHLPQNTDILFLSSLPDSNYFLDKSEWWVVFQNDSVTVAVRKNSQNKMNRERVKKYYAEKNLIVNEDELIDFRWLEAKNPQLAVETLEEFPYGRWPSPKYREDWQKHRDDFLSGVGKAGELG